MQLNDDYRDQHAYFNIVLAIVAIVVTLIVYTLQ